MNWSKMRTRIIAVMDSAEQKATLAGDRPGFGLQGLKPNIIFEMRK